MCANGKRQSPVDLVKDAAIKGVYPNFIFKNYDVPMKNPIVINNGHSSKFSNMFINFPILIISNDFSCQS
jgi:carbonic anhydrase